MAAMMRVMWEWTKLHMNERAAQQYAVEHLAGGKGGRHHHCRMHPLLLPPMPNVWKVESGQREGWVLVSQGLVLSVGLSMIVYSFAKVQDRAMAAESVQRHVSSVGEYLFGELPSRACPNWTANKEYSNIASEEYIEGRD